VLVQGIAEMVRCVVCLKTGVWTPRLKDADEIDVVEQQLAGSTYVDEAAKREAMAKAKSIERRASAAAGACHEQCRTRHDDADADRRRDHAGLPTAFTLMGLGIMFGFVAFYDPVVHFWTTRSST
jgi:hypothetical protein